MMLLAAFLPLRFQLRGGALAPSLAHADAVGQVRVFGSYGGLCIALVGRRRQIPAVGDARILTLQS